MKEMLLTSSALILALLVLRLLFRNRISRRVQYALWLLVLARRSRWCSSWRWSARFISPLFGRP